MPADSREAIESIALYALFVSRIVLFLHCDKGRNLRTPGTLSCRLQGSQIPLALPHHRTHVWAHGST
jgi:hypothetical protein